MEESSNCFLLLPACFCRAITCCRLGVGALKKVCCVSVLQIAPHLQVHDNAVSWCGPPSLLLLYRTQYESREEVVRQEGTESCNNHSGNEPEGKFLIYTVPWVYLMCFNRVVGNIQWFWVKQNSFLLRQIKGNIALFVVHAAADETLNVKSGTRALKKKIVLFHRVCTES